jgi:protein-tyrosine phosphatase
MRRDLEWAGCVNVRDLGGLATADGGVTRFGAVVRADNIRQLTAEGWRSASRYGISTILDLRSEAECNADPAPPVDVHLDVVRISLFDDFDSDAAYRADLEKRVAGSDPREAYRVLYTDALERNRALFARALQVVAGAGSGGVLVHCLGGKDRTGVLAALLLRLAGVPIASVADDYHRSEQRLGIPDSAPVGVIDRVIESLEIRHGSVEDFFLDAGATVTDVAQARERLRANAVP